MPEKIPVCEGAFTETSEGGVLIGNKCKACGQPFFPKAKLCFACLTDDMEEVSLSRRGKLYSYTIGRMASLHFQPPYVLGYIDMPEGVRVFAPLEFEESEYRNIKIGMEMEVAIKKLWDEGDKEIIGYKFKPIN